ncbi:hydroxyacylglutathione hydrolase [Pseudomonas sp. SL4(2022)]|uniref:hydroxyacylglutathione hydrolase n=1 Tax=Pseudomonas sp. SL4(2022) TaxID=2994661 RepID=UPI00226D8BC4|nr:hydroxyacylglutathione hydrolase [Pseudomonas sp. SL4(2022)]WAC44586.1 hydroxyacylglutathione hydrolase [Pseudomonas sp. SL4(2022)]
MIKIDALPAFSDNYIWLLQDQKQRRCAVVDPGDAAPVEAWLAANPGWQLSDILITHHHFDHVGGIERLKAATGARVLCPANEKIQGRDLGLYDSDQVDVLGQRFDIYEVPGHTLGHIAYIQPEQHWLFCGDTLFAGGCGRLFEGSPEQMHTSLSRLAALPGQTQVYCTHEYTLSNLRFAAAVEPDNPQVQQRLAQVGQWREDGQISLPSSIALERATNPFLRCHEPAVITIAAQREAAANLTPTQVFAALRAWKDHF